MPLNLTTILVVAAAILSVLSAFTHVPLWVAVLLVCLALLIPGR